MVKLSHDNLAKNNWREAWFRFLRKNKNYLRGSSKEWQVAFFPGIEGLEIEVYERLGIPRENLIGLENDEQRYEKLKKKGLGIRLSDEPMDSLDFFTQTNDKFDIVNLDYEGMFNSKVMDTLEQIAGRQVLREESILGITVYAQREKKDIKKIYSNASFRDEEFKQSELIKQFFDSHKDIKPDLKEVFYGTEWGIDKQRDIGLSRVISLFFQHGLDNLRINPIFLRNPEFKKCEEGFRRMIEKDPDHVSQLNRNCHHRPNLKKYFFQNDFGPTEEHYFGPRMAEWYESRPYFPKEHIRHKYISQNASLMLSDFLFFTQHRKIIDKYKYLAEQAYIDLNIKNFIKIFLKKSQITHSDINQLDKQTTKDYKLLHKHISYDSILFFRPRIHLGSSANLPKLIGTDYYQKRFEDESNGIPVEETWNTLFETFKATKTQLPRFEAHYTMGTYGPKPIKEETEEIKDPPSSVPDKLDIIPLKYWNRLSTNSQKRFEYFIEEDLMRVGLNNDNINQLTNELQGCNIHKLLSKNNLSDLQIYAFFDDIFLEINDGRIPNSNRILELYENIQKPDWNYRLVEKVQQAKSIDNITDTIEIEKPLLTLEIYEQLTLKESKDDKWISENYRTKKPKSMKAYKAWVTIKHGKKKEKTISDLGYKVMSMIEDRKSKKQIMEEFGLSKTELAGYIASKNRGDYTNILEQLRKRKNHIVDSHGVVHSSNSKALETEKGYK